MAQSISQTLKQLNGLFKVGHIMPGELMTASSAEEAPGVLSANSNLDVIPIVNELGEITHYIDRDDDGVKAISSEQLVNEDADILTLVGRLKDREFCFVQNASGQVKGYIHFSDLNHHVVKIPFFVVLQQLEEKAAARIVGSMQIEESDIKKTFSDKRFRQLQEKLTRLRSKRADRDWINAMTFGDILQFGYHHRKFNLSSDDRETLCTVRNRICHSDGDPLVAEHADVKNLLAEAIRICSGKSG